MASNDGNRELVKAYKALGDPTRLRLLRLLAGKEEMGCGELIQALRESPHRRSPITPAGWRIAACWTCARTGSSASLPCAETSCGGWPRRC